MPNLNTVAPLNVCAPSSVPLDFLKQQKTKERGEFAHTHSSNQVHRSQLNWATTTGHWKRTYSGRWYPINRNLQRQIDFQVLFVILYRQQTTSAYLTGSQTGKCAVHICQRLVYMLDCLPQLMRLFSWSLCKGSDVYMLV